MWRLKVSDGGNNPYIYSTNNFVGRQTWEFDPDYGTSEERAEIETARENFWKNRYQVPASSDLLWRMQVIRSHLSLNIAKSYHIKILEKKNTLTCGYYVREDVFFFFRKDKLK